MNAKTELIKTIWYWLAITSSIEAAAVFRTPLTLTCRAFAAAAAGVALPVAGVPRTRRSRLRRRYGHGA